MWGIKRDMNEVVDISKKGLIVSFIHWCISFYTDKLVFSYDKVILGSDEFVAFILTKFIFLITLVILWQFIFLFIKNRGLVNKRYLKFSFIYFAIMMGFLLVTWPGVWRWDEFSILSMAKGFTLNYWQHYITSIFYIISMMMIPFPTGIVIIQLFIISLIVGYIVYKVNRYTRNSKLSYLMFLPFLMFPIIENNLYPLRLSIYSYVEILFLFEILFIKLDKRAIKLKNIILLAMLISLLASWRSEGIYYVLLAPMLIIVAFYKDMNLKNKAKIVILSFMFTAILFIPQYLGNKTVSGDDYEITAIANPLAAIVKNTKNNEDIKQDLENIDKVLYIDVINDYDKGMEAYWSGWLVRYGYTPKEFSEFKKSYNNIVMKNMDIFIKERMKTFLETSGYGNKGRIWVYDSAYIFDEEQSSVESYKDFKSNKLTKPISSELRKKAILGLQCRLDKGYRVYEVNGLYSVVYNLIPSIIVLLVIAIISIFKKKYTIGFIVMINLIKVPLIFITAPAPLFMYYVPTYMYGYVMLMLFIVIILYNKNAERKINLFV